MTEDEAKAAARALVPTAPPMTLSEREGHLARTADLLRGERRPGRLQGVHLPLVLLQADQRRLPGGVGQSLEGSGGDHEFAAFAENHRFVIPEGCLWGDLRSRTENIGSALVTTLRGIEEVNPETLYGIFGQTSIWTNKQTLTDATLRDLIEHFSVRPLTNALVPPDMFGQAYEYLIKRFADQSNKAAGEYYTPRSVVGLMVNILDPGERDTVYDPACGTAGMLIEVINHVKERGGNPRLLRGRLFGQEKVLTTSGIARMNLLLHGVDDFRVAKDDTLRDPSAQQSFGDPAAYATSLRLPTDPANSPRAMIHRLVPTAVQVIGFMTLIRASPSYGSGDPVGIAAGDLGMFGVLAAAVVVFAWQLRPLTNLVLRRPVVATVALMAVMIVMVLPLLLWQDPIAEFPVLSAVIFGGLLLLIGTGWELLRVREETAKEEITRPLDSSEELERRRRFGLWMNYLRIVIFPVAAGVLIGAVVLLS